MRHVTFIRPNIADMRSGDAMEPLVFAILASRTPRDLAVTLYDDHIEEIPYDRATDLVAITVDTFSARRAYQIAAEYRRRGVRVVMGGHHPTLLPEEALQFCDSIVTGDAEGAWEALVEDARHGRLARVYAGAKGEHLEGPLPDRSIFRGKRYAPIALVQYGRGCRFACDFCSVHAFYGERLAHRPVADVVAEIRSLNRRLVFFVDDNIFSSLAAAEELLRAIRPLGIRWVCQASIDVARHPRLLPLMAESGCIALLVGFESLDERNLAQMNKPWNVRGSSYADAIRRIHAHGIMIYGTFVFGYDHDTRDAFDATVDFAIDSGFFLANFNPLTPTPGTALYRRLGEQQRLEYPTWWLDPDYRYGRAIFSPQGMTTDELTAGCLHARRRFYGYATMLGRLRKAPRQVLRPYNLGLYLLSNTISRREIFRKQGRALGPPAGLEATREPA